MRLAVATSLLALAACTTEGVAKLPPADRLYYPTGVAFVGADAGAGEGTLVVANSNFDNRYSYGSLVSLDLNAVGLPPFPGASDAGVQQIDGLGLGGHPGEMVLTDAFAGPQIGTFALPAGGTRLFIPTRGQGNYVHVVDLDLPGASRRLTCFQGGADPQDCTVGALGLTYNEAHGIAKPRAPEPIGVTVDAPSHQVFVTHRMPATSPLGTFDNPESYLVRLDALSPAISDDSFLSIGQGGADAVTVDGRFAFIVGYAARTLAAPPLLRYLDTAAPATVYGAALETSFHAAEGRDITTSTDGSRLYILGRVPAALIVASVSGLAAGTPNVIAVHGILLQLDPNRILRLSRPGRGDLFAITSSQANVVSFYDEEVGDLVAEVGSIGKQPYGLAADVRPGGGARIYVSLFGDGQLAVIDLPDLNKPEEARLVARVGLNQSCLIDGSGCP